MLESMLKGNHLEVFNTSSVHCLISPPSHQWTSKIELCKVIDGAFTLDAKLMLNKNLGGILGGTQCQMGDSIMLNEC
jgi:hypothetical protein